MCYLLETKNDPQVTKMTQKFEFIATRTIEKPSLKSSTYYASIGSDGNREPDLDGKPYPVSSPSNTDDADIVTDSNMSVTVGMNEHDRIVAESADDALPTETVDEVSEPQLRKERLSDKFRKWHEDELKLYSESDWPQRSAQSTVSSSPRRSVDDQDAVNVNQTEAGSLLLDFGGGQTSDVVASEETEGEPSTLIGDDQETLDLTDDILQRNLVETGRSDEFDMFEDPDGTSSKIVDVKDDVQDIDFSQVVERNRLDRPEERPSDSQLFSEDSYNIDRVEPRIRSTAKRGTYCGLSPPQMESANADLGEVDLEGPAAERSVTTIDPGLAPDSELGPDVEARFDSEMREPEDRAIRPDELQYEEQLQMMARDVDDLQQEVDTTVNSRELETTDEIVVETKVTEVKTVLMHLGESGNISVMETTEVKTDTDMKETKKIVERDEVAVSHRSDRKHSDFVPLSPSPSPGGSLPSRTPDRQSPSTSLLYGDSVDKLTEADLADSVGDIRPGVGVDAGLYVAICLYEPETDDVMSLHEGEFLEILEDTAADWWLVKKTFDGREGYVPAHYLRDKHVDDRMMEEEVVKQMDTIYVESSKTVFK